MQTRKPFDSMKNDMELTSEKETMKAQTAETQRNYPDEIDSEFYTEIGGEG
ncbi:hypothetical protein [Nitrospira sp. BLG_2]|uniref:hypothetical protein n=1 Tax=Nitrospira sp. BLG_2 TaxID=3397507 RepID=UPI003B9BA5C4